MKQKWYHYLAEELRPWALQSLELLKQEKANPGRYENYDFVVFPIAKAYETFLKSYLFEWQLIDERTYNSKKFAIGRALNPDVRLEQRDEYWFFDDAVRTCGEEVAREIWETWLVRNRLMHLYPGEVQETSLEQAEAKVNQFINVIQLCAVCKRS